MKPYALVFTSSGMFVVMYYSDWAERPNGSITQTSNNRELLEDEADWRNEEIGFMKEYEQYSHFDGNYKSL